MTSYTDTQLVEILRKRIAKSGHNQVARELGVSHPFLHDVMQGNRGVSEKIARALGFERVVIYRKVA